MQTYNTSTKVVSEQSFQNSEAIRAIAYSMDTLVPGFYFWLNSYTLRVGGCIPDDQPYRYPGTIHSYFGFAIVLPGCHIFTTYKGSYDPDKHQIDGLPGFKRKTFQPEHLKN